MDSGGGGGGCLCRLRLRARSDNVAANRADHRDLYGKSARTADVYLLVKCECLKMYTWAHKECHRWTKTC